MLKICIKPFNLDMAHVFAPNSSFRCVPDCNQWIIYIFVTSLSPDRGRLQQGCECLPESRAGTSAVQQGREPRCVARGCPPVSARPEHAHGLQVM